MSVDNFVVIVLDVDVISLGDYKGSLGPAEILAVQRKEARGHDIKFVVMS